jgi:hypothetical protein
MSDLQGRVGTTDIPLTVALSTGISGYGTLTPSRAGRTESVLMTVVVTEARYPRSTGIRVTADISNIGGDEFQRLVDDGMHGDAVANDGVYSIATLIPVQTATGRKHINFQVQDEQNNGYFSAVILTVLETGPLSTFAIATPDNVLPGGLTVLSAAVTPGTSPASSDIAVVADLSGIGGSPVQELTDDGQNGDLVAGDSLFTLAASVAPLALVGARELPVVASDAQGRTAATHFKLSVIGAGDLSARGEAVPATVTAGTAALLEIIVTLAENPTST